ncbi:T9SS type A sorting domain-containing protein, partial [bacterium]|nr:T9SS type A sorting domain-containing protein [bacterium]
EVQYLRQTTDSPQFATSATAPAAVNALALSEDGHWVIAATNSGVTVIEHAGSAVDPLPIIPDDFTLRAYPNPFNGSTTVSLSLPHSEEVMLSVFDVTGRELLSREASVNQSELQLDFTGFASGSYLLRAESRYGTSKTLRLLYLP